MTTTTDFSISSLPKATYWTPKPRATFTVIATTTCYAGHTNEVEAHTILEDGSPLFGGAYHLCRTCDERNQIHLASFRKVEVAA